MQQSWANYGIDLHLELTGSRVRAGLEAALRDAMRTGRLGPGVPELRAALAGYLGRARGVIASPEDVIICAGFAHGLALICQVLAERGGTAVAMEAYGHLLHRRIVAAQGLRVLSLRVDDGGAVPGDLGPAGASADRGPAHLPRTGSPAVISAGVLTPAPQYPLGLSLAPTRRTAFAGWAARAGGLIVEDDYDGEYRFDRQPVGAIQALAPEHVVYAATASKSLAPGLRLGSPGMSAPMSDEVVAAKETSG